MVNVSLNKKELMAFAVLVNANRDNATLQRDTNMSYMESIELKNKLQKVIDKNIGWAEQSKILGR